jgi:hypothetical protein
MKIIIKVITVFLFSIPAYAGSYSYEGGAFFVTALNHSLLAKGEVTAKFAVRPPAMMCGVFGVSSATITGFKEELRLKARDFLEKETGPALAIFFSPDRAKLFEDYPEAMVNQHAFAEELPILITLGDAKTETYEFAILTGNGFFVFKDGKFTRSFMKDYGNRLDGLLRYSEYLQDPKEAFHYEGLWGCLEPKAFEPDSAGQPATRSESKSGGSDKPQPEAEGRSR